jgi:hypothetical protein
MDMSEKAYLDIKAERERQDALWGGPSHDDNHDALDWLEFIDYQVTRTHDAVNFPYEVDWTARERLVKIAALAVAAIESIDRRA